MPAYGFYLKNGFAIAPTRACFSSSRRPIDLRGKKNRASAAYGRRRLVVVRIRVCWDVHFQRGISVRQAGRAFGKDDPVTRIVPHRIVQIPGFFGEKFFDPHTYRARFGIAERRQENAFAQPRHGLRRLLCAVRDEQHGSAGRQGEYGIQMHRKPQSVVPFMMTG